jgi:cell wall-associated NlpC family hydrolase
VPRVTLVPASLASRRCIAAAVLAWLCGAALAGPAAASGVDDPVLTLLQARGLVAMEAVETVEAARDAAPAPASGTAGDAADATSQLVLAAMNFLDIDYRYGGNSAEEGFDCSGFTRHVFATALGVSLPRRADEQARAPALHAVARDRLQPGDLVFFNTLRRAFSHVGLYIGDGRFVHAPRTGAQVRIESLGAGYWARRFDGARRLGASASASAAPAATAAPVADEVFDGWTSPH